MVWYLITKQSNNRLQKQKNQIDLSGSHIKLRTYVDNLKTNYQDSKHKMNHL